MKTFFFIAAILVAAKSTDAVGRYKRAAGEFTVGNAKEKADALIGKINKGVDDMRAAERSHNAKLSLNAGSEMCLAGMKMTKLYMFVRRNKGKLRPLYKRVSSHFMEMLEAAYEEMKSGVERFPKNDPLVDEAGDLIETQLQLIKRSIKALKGSIFDKLSYKNYYDRHFKDNDKKLLEVIEKRVKSKAAHVASLVPFMTMALGERVAIGFYLNRDKNKLEQMVKNTAEKLRSLAAQV